MNQAVYTLTYSLKMVQTSFPHHNYMNSIYKLTANACTMHVPMQQFSETDASSTAAL